MAYRDISHDFGVVSYETYYFMALQQVLLWLTILALPFASFARITKQWSESLIWAQGLALLM